jgi:DNA-binding LacI/PurR family transcriptional regulator
MSGPTRRATPTIYDVARAAGVAPSTVSRAFSRPGRVNPETEEHVRAIARSIGYQGRLPRNPALENLPMIGVLVSDVTDPAVAEFICGAESAAAEANYTILLSRCQAVEQGETEALDHILGNAEGVVLANPRIAESVVAAIGVRWPLVVLDQASAGAPSILTNQSQGAHLAAEHLAGLGHHSISYVAGPEKSWADGSRWHALQNAAADLNLDIRRLGPFMPTVSGGCEAAGELVRTRTSAVITYNDYLALGVIHRLTKAGMRVPDDVSVVGYDDIPAARLVTPSLTTVAAPTRAQGIVAVHHLLSIIKGARPRSDEPTVLPVQLIARESSGRLLDHRGSAGLTRVG